MPQYSGGPRLDDPWGGQLDDYEQAPMLSRGGTSNLADILERVLDKGVVIAGDICVSLVDVELLTIKLRLLIASVDKAREIAINWWEDDPWLTRGEGDGEGSSHQPDRALSRRIDKIETILDRLSSHLDQAGELRQSGSGG
jgi:hypothetical protein